MGRELKYTISADASKYERAMQRVEGATKSAERVANSAFKAMGAGITVAAGAYALMAKETLATGDRIHKLNLRLGLSTEYLSQLKHASDLSRINAFDFRIVVYPICRGRFPRRLYQVYQV